MDKQHHLHSERYDSQFSACDRLTLGRRAGEWGGALLIAPHTARA